MRGKTVEMVKSTTKLKTQTFPETVGQFPAVLVMFIALPLIIEIVLIASDYGIFGSTRWRNLSYQYFAFWAGLLYNWQPNYELQPYSMFFTYPFFHAGLVHLLGNMLALGWLGQIAVPKIGQRLFALLYLISGIGGGVAFGFLTNSAQPMVGASGALFGLAGAWQCWSWLDRRSTGNSLWHISASLFALVFLNLVMWTSTKGQLAWETHLGGFITGGLFAYIHSFWSSNQVPDTKPRQ